MKMNLFNQPQLIVLGGHARIGKTTWVIFELTRLAKKGVVFSSDVDAYCDVDTEVFGLSGMSAEDVTEQAKLCHQKHDRLDYVIVEILEALGMMLSIP